MDDNYRSVHPRLQVQSLKILCAEISIFKHTRKSINYKKLVKTMSLLHACQQQFLQFSEQSLLGISEGLEYVDP